MPSSIGGRNRSIDQLAGSCTPAMWPYGMLPWQHGQQFAYPMPFPVMMPQMTPAWFPLDNFASLPPKAKLDADEPVSETFQTSKPTRRFSDPGPALIHKLGEKAHVGFGSEHKDCPMEECLKMSESQLFAEEAQKDQLFCSLLQELRTARNLNRQLCLELHKAKMQIQLVQQRSNEQQPGSTAALVRKLYEAHQVRSDVLSHWNKAEELLYTKRNCYPNKIETEEPEQLLMKERDFLWSRLQSTEKKIHLLRQPQWNGSADGGGFYKAAAAPEHRTPLSSKVSRSHSFGLASPSTSDPPSLDDVDISTAKHGGACQMTSVLTNQHRPIHDGRIYTSGGMVSGDSLKRDLEQQLASVERDRRLLEHELRDSLGARRSSEDRVFKLERLVSVLRKKLENQTSTHSVCSVPSPVASNRSTATPTPSNDFSFVGYDRDGPASLPSYLQVIGPITQL